MPCHHKLNSYLGEYLEASNLRSDPKGYLFPTIEGQSGRFSQRPMSQADVYRMICRRAAAAGMETRINCHTFRATGITEYLRNVGKLEIAQMANHESTRTTGLYDSRND